MTNLIVHGSAPVALIGGAQVDPELIKTVLQFSTVLVAADGGADAALALGETPVAVIGDLDSLTNKARAAFSKRLYHVTEQETTDFEKALVRIECNDIVAVGFLGGRLDHTMSVLNVLARHRNRRVILVSDHDVCFLAPAHVRLSLTPGCRIGLLPLDAAKVTTNGLRWDILGADYHPVGAISVSNEVAEAEVSICVQGPVLVTLPVGQLAAVIDAVHAR